MCVCVLRLVGFGLLFVGSLMCSVCFCSSCCSRCVFVLSVFAFAVLLCFCFCIVFLFVCVCVVFACLCSDVIFSRLLSVFVVCVCVLCLAGFVLLFMCSLLCSGCSL